MNDYLFLVLLSLLLGLLGLLAFLWALHRDQYDDLEGSAARVLEEDDRPIVVEPVSAKAGHFLHLNKQVMIPPSTQRTPRMTSPITGCLQKMRVTLDTEAGKTGGDATQWPVLYELVIGEETLPMNPLIGQQVTLTHNGSIVCINCERITRKSFSQGYCYNCFKTLAECDQCIMSPEKCHYHEGTCRDPEWGLKYCMQPHYVYLANSSGIKVGITRGTQLPTRWIDQGAIHGRVIAEVSSRRVSGLVEAALRQFISDRTSWQAMLKGKIAELDLDAEWQVLYPQVKDRIEAIRQEHGEGSVKLVDAPKLENISFPVESHPEKIKSLNLDKTPTVSGLLQGIKGQYLILDTGVINIRKYTGYEVEFSSSPPESA